ncbi:MAG TPA: sigma 54-interacting transcriptional regulator [Blastocatellia bacterium]|nr:sigma 54-interacting transcriptional regulator [Blastocatellia bacterium]
MAASQDSLSLDRKIRMYEARERILHRINPEINKAIDLDKFLQGTVNELGKMMAVDRCDMMIITPEGKLRIRHEYRASDDLPSSKDIQIPFDLSKLPPNVNLTQPIAVDDIGALNIHPVLKLLASTMRTSSLLVVPITMKGELSAIVGFHICNGKTRHWLPEEIDFVQSVTQQIGVGYEYTRIYNEKESEVRVTRALLEIATGINTKTEFSEMAAFVIGRSIDLLNADYGGLGILDGSERQLHFDTVGAAVGFDPRKVNLHTISLVDNPMVRESLSARQTLKLETVDQSEIAEYFLNEVFSGKLALIVPILIKEKVFGTLIFVWTEPRDPFQSYEVELANGIANQIAIALERDKLTAEVLRLSRELQGVRASQNLVGSSEKIKRSIQMAQHVADTYTTVLIQGESGTGKELIANLIQENSSRRDKAYVKINCGALPETLLESELFGHEKGAFTDARSRRIGKFEEADGGTLFLDEIAEMSLGAQVKLLRVLQNGEFSRVGGNEQIKVDVRVIAASNVNLEEAVEQNKFRRDLFYRLNVYPIWLSPLRERKEDVPLLAVHFLERYKKKSGKTLTGISPKAIALLKNFDWPGNVRELENVIERAVIIARERIITVEDLPDTIRGAEHEPDAPRTIEVELGSTMDTIEKQVILETLGLAKGDKTRTAQILGIGRKTLYRKLQQYGQPE